MPGTKLAVIMLLLYFLVSADDLYGQKKGQGSYSYSIDNPKIPLKSVVHQKWVHFTTRLKENKTIRQEKRAENRKTREAASASTKRKSQNEKVRRTGKTKGSFGI